MQFGLFLVSAIVLAITPGPGILYVLARTVSGGRSDGMASTLGTAVGGLVHVVVAALGLSALLTASASAFTIVKYVGAGYLVYLGIRTILSAKRQANKASIGKATDKNTVRRVFLEGVLTETLNIKTALFFLAFIPQFVDPSASTIPQFVFLGLICVTLNTTVDFIVVLFACSLTSKFQARPEPPRGISYASGTLMIGLGAYVAFADAQN